MLENHIISDLRRKLLFSVLIVLHIFISLGLIISVLMQSAKGEGLAGAFGGSGGGVSGAVFGGRGAASFLSRATTVLAVAFMINCILLTFSGGGTGVPSSRISGEAQKAMEDAQVSPMQLPGEGQPQGQQQAQPDVQVEPVMPPPTDEGE
ncbi:MAG: preprotein translocase subunit SecG [candidate division Zixibacteria bacterium]|nr:preprotein translocase subunit SecG [candidate division Zixibacteria bacterium]